MVGRTVVMTEGIRTVRVGRIRGSPGEEVGETRADVRILRWRAASPAGVSIMFKSGVGFFALFGLGW